jgi:hypothetical protein
MRTAVPYFICLDSLILNLNLHVLFGVKTLDGHIYFTCSLFNEAFSSSDYIASNERMIVNEVEGSGRSLIQGTILASA